MIGRQRVRRWVVRWMTGVALCAMHAGILAAPAPSPALWKVSDDDSSVYILGTVHFLPPTLEWRSERIDKALQGADLVWFEAPAMDPAKQFEIAQAVQALGMNPPGVTLSANLDPDTRAELQMVLARFGMGLPMVEPMRPWLVAVTLTTLEMQMNGYVPQSGVDFALWSELSAQGREIAYLETLEEQLQVFAGLSDEDEVEMLEQTLAEFDDTGEMLARLVNAWAEGDLATMDALVNESMRDASPALYDRIFVRRNRNWVARIEQMLADDHTHFIAVGAGHMVSGDGVVAMLEAAGHRVSQP